MAARDVPQVFKVAFSLAGEQREIVEKIAIAVEARLGDSTVFYDEWYQHWIAGKRANIKLQELYSERCTLAVVCISGEYGDKPWTITEHDAITARIMEGYKTTDKENLAVLPIRVGDGEVRGVLYNEIAPDVRNMSTEEAADLIVSRLALVERPDNEEVESDWPATAPELNWNLADHSEVYEKFGMLLTRDSPWRFLPIVGPSETGKSVVTKQMLGNALAIKDLACGRFDFKGTTDMDDAVRAFARRLNVPPPPGKRLTEQLSRIFDSLAARKRITLLIFDTYEMAQMGTEWMENQLLPDLLRAEWLRLVVAGQKVPAVGGAIWESKSCPVVTLKPPPAKDWYEYGKRHQQDLTMEDVETLVRYSGDKASLLSQLLGPKG